MAVEGLERIVGAHPVFAGLDDSFISLVCGCARNVVFEAGDQLLREGQASDEFFLIRHGHVAMQVNVPGRGAVTFQTLGEGEIAGLSWLIPPYRWAFDAKALEQTRAIGIDARCLRQKCEDDHDLGYEMMKRVVPTLVQRLHETRLQMLDVYATPA